MSKLSKIVFLVIISSVLNVLNVCQVQASTNDFGLWNPIILKIPITKKLSVVEEFQSRFLDNVTDFDQHLLRSSLGYYVTDNLELRLGHDWFGGYNPSYSDTHVVWEQSEHKFKVKDLTVINRTRIEERFLEDIDMSMRFRHSLRLMYPITKSQKTHFVLWDEIFVNPYSRADGPNSGFSENRIFAGLNHKLSEHVSLEAGYQLQHITSGEDTLNHIALVSFFVTLPQFF